VTVGTVARARVVAVGYRRITGRRSIPCVAREAIARGISDPAAAGEDIVSRVPARVGSAGPASATATAESCRPTLARGSTLICGPALP